VHTQDYFAVMSDGAKIALRVHLPDDAGGARPTLLAVSPYRFDNDEVPPTHSFLWYEMGPYRWYVERHGYAFVRADVRGTGRSDGSRFGYLDKRERRDLYEIIEWIAQQPWSSGKIGAIGQSYYAMSQWAMASERPPHLTCIAPYDGHTDLCSFGAHSGGIPNEPFVCAWWIETMRPVNDRPFSGPPRELPQDFSYEVSRHQVRDDYWAERSYDLSKVDIPVYAVGAWSKLDLHTSGVIDGFLRVGGPKKLRLTGSPSALIEFSTPAFHERVLLPFYDWALKGLATGYEQRPTVEYDILGAKRTAAAAEWPPANAKVKEFHLASGPTNSVTSLNDGRLVTDPRSPGADRTSYSYPDPQWQFGNVVMGPQGPDRVKRVLTFTTDALTEDLTIAGPSELLLHLSSTATTTDIIVKLAEQSPQSEEARSKGLQPDSVIVTKGWLRSGHRRPEPNDAPFGAPIFMNAQLSPLAPGEVYELRVPLMAVSYRFSKGSRLRVEVSNADSRLFDRQFCHVYAPEKAGTDTIHHSKDRPSRLRLLALAEG
jgi:uncharacterized protein